MVLEYLCRYGNKILVTDELPSGQMVDQWESVESDTVKTPLEVMAYCYGIIFFSNVVLLKKH